MAKVTEEEFRRNPDLKSSDLDDLKSWLKTQQHLPEISDKMLILFHHSRLFDLSATKDMIEHYYTMRTNTPELFTNRDLTSSDVARTVLVVNIAPLPVADPNGYRINYFGLRDTDASHFVFADVLKLIFMTYDANDIKYGTVPGYHAIFDMKGAKLKHMARMGLSLLKKFILFGEKALPIRQEIIHFVNVASWIDKLMALIKPWLGKETADNMHYHSVDNETLYKYIPKECLPEELGGYLASVEEFSAANCRNLKGLSKHFAEEEKLRVDESKRITIKKAGK